MIILHRHKGLLPYTIRWFDPKPRFQAWPLTVYYQSINSGPISGLIQKEFWTLFQMLNVADDELLSVMNSTTRNEVRQAERIGVLGSLCAPADFERFFNSFAAEKNIEGVDAHKLRSFGESLKTTQASYDGRVLAMHAYLMDPEARRTRLLFSASARFSDSADRSLIGKANRYLHFWDMRIFRDQDIEIYDWGGIAKDAQDPEKQGINRFKEAFGGNEQLEYHYYPFFLKGWRQ